MALEGVPPTPPPEPNDKVVAKGTGGKGEIDPTGLQVRKLPGGDNVVATNQYVNGDLALVTPDANASAFNTQVEHHRGKLHTAFNVPMDASNESAQARNAQLQQLDGLRSVALNATSVDQLGPILSAAAAFDHNVPQLRQALADASARLEALRKTV